MMSTRRKRTKRGAIVKGVSGKTPSRASVRVKSAYASEKEGKKSLILRRAALKRQKTAPQIIFSLPDYVREVGATIREPLLVLNQNLEVLSANRSFYETFQVKRKETEGKPFYRIGDRQWDIPELRQKLEQVLHKQTSFEDFKLKQKFPRIGERTILVNARSISRQAEEPKFILLSIRDITESKKVEEANLRFSSFPAVNPTPIVETDIAGRVLYMNPAAKRLFPDLPKTVGRHPFLAGFSSVVNELKSGKKEWVLRQVEVEGAWYGQTIFAVEEGLRIRIYASDITERKSAEEALSKSEEKYRFLYEEGLSFNIIIGVDQTIKDANKTALNTLGYRKDEVVGKLVQEFVSEEEREKAIKLLADAFSGKITEGNEVSVLAKDGSVHTILFSPGQIILKETDAVQGIVATGIDITERKRAEEVLQKAKEHLETRVKERTVELEQINLALQKEISERKWAEDAVKGQQKRFNDVLETLPAYLVLLTPDYHVAFANRFFRERFGESHGKRCYEYLFDRSEPCENCETYKVLKTNQPHHWEWTGPDGRNYDIYDFPFTDTDDSSLIMEMGIDITERKQAEEELRRHKEHLEELVNERTGELKSRNVQLAVEIAERKQVEEALRKSEKRLKRAQEIAHLGSWELDLLSNRLTWSDEVYRIFGLKPQEFSATYEAFLEAVHPDDRQAVDAAYSGSLREGRDTYEIEHRVVRKADGEVRIVHEKCEHIRDEKGRIVRSVGMVHDITERKQAEERLQKQAVMLANVSEAIIGFGPDMRINFWSPSAERLYGYTSSEALGCQASDLLRAVYLGITRDEAVAQLMKTGHLKVENIHHTKDGRALHVEYHATSVYNLQNELTGIVTVIHDITERKKAEEELRQTRDYLENLFNYANAPIICWDSDFKITQFNHAFERLTDCKAEEVLGKDLSILFPPESREESLDNIRRTLGGEYWEVVEIPILRKAGDTRIVLWNSANVYTDDGKTLLATIAQGQDITERKQAEEQIKKLNEALKSHSAKLEASNQELEAFTYSVSHDLRAPLRSVDGFSRALLEDYAQILDERGQDYLKRMRGAADKMKQLIEDLLNLSRLARAEMKREETDLSALVHTIAVDLQKSQPERKVEFKIEKKLVANVDRRLLEIALENLLQNAWKFTSKQSEARIEFTATEKNGETVYLVRDNGVGFDMTYANRLFIPFQRLHSTDEFPGTGIGLATVKRIIDRHGGRIWAEAGVEKGSTFFFTLGSKITPETNRVLSIPYRRGAR